MDLQIHKVTLGNLSCGTNDMQEVTTTISINYYIESGFVEDIYRTLRTDFESRVIVNNMQESLKSTTSSFKAGELLQKREEVKIMFLNTLRVRLALYHITVIDVQLEDYQFSDAFNKAIDEKTTAEQNAQTEKNKLEIVRYQQEQQILIKEAEATMIKIQAEAYANATLTKALADSEAIRLVSEQLKVSPEYLYYLFLMQWDGKLPIYWASDGSPIPFLNITTTP